MAEMRVIRVTGKGFIKLKPDLTIVNIALEGCHKAYEDTLRKSSEDTELLKDLFEKLGFARDDVRTRAFNVNPKYESYQTKAGNWKERFVGYSYNHSLKVEFDSDNEKLGKILYALAHAKEIAPDFSIAYAIKDKEAAKNLLIARAVEDAKAKAAVLAKAAGVKLMNIQSIDYSWGEVSFELPMARYGKRMTMADGACENGSAYAMDIDPEDIEESDTVTVVWGID